MAYDNNVYKNKTEDYKIAPSKVIREIFACGSGKPGALDWTPAIMESGIQLRGNDWNPESKFH